MGTSILDPTLPLISRFLPLVLLSIFCPLALQSNAAPSSHIIHGIPVISSPVSYSIFSRKTIAYFKSLKSERLDSSSPRRSPPSFRVKGRHPPGVGHHRPLSPSNGHHVPPPSPPPPSKPSLGPVYNGGSILAAPIAIHIVWYGQWRLREKFIIRTFVRSMGLPPLEGAVNEVPAWWAVTRGYRNRLGQPVSSQVRLGSEFSYTRPRFGNVLNQTITQIVIRSALQRFGGTLPIDSKGIYVLLTGPEVKQSGYCYQRCGFHDFIRSPTTALPGVRGSGQPLAYAWVGNPISQCPGFCGFPYAAPDFIPKEFAVLTKPPNGNLGVDSVVAILAHEIAGIATNPFLTAWYAGSNLLPQEISDFCLGIFGPGAFPGNPGMFRETAKGAGYNAVGAGGRKFLLPWLWNVKIGACEGRAPTTPRN